MQISKKLRLFGKEAEIIFFDIDEFNAEILAEKTGKVAETLHRIFNIYDEKSEISMLNKKRKLIVSDPLLEVIKKAIEFSKFTDGAYDVSLGKQFIVRKKGEVNLPKIECTYNDIHIENNAITLSHPDVLIDLGSVAKGYITDKMAEFLKHEGVDSFIINSRGDISVYGASQVIGIGHPREKDKILKTIKLENKSVATSGDYNQFAKDFKNSHILNSKDLISVTVVADTLTEAELFSTSLFVMDKDSRNMLMEENKQVSAMLVDENLNITFINQFDYLLF